MWTLYKGYHKTYWRHLITKQTFLIASIINLILQLHLFGINWQYLLNTKALSYSTDLVHFSSLQASQDITSLPSWFNITYVYFGFVYLLIMTFILLNWQYLTDKQPCTSTKRRHHHYNHHKGCSRYYIRSSTKGARIGYKHVHPSLPSIPTNILSNASPNQIPIKW